MDDDLKVIYITSRTKKQSRVDSVMCILLLFVGYLINYHFMGDSFLIKCVYTVLMLGIIINMGNKYIKKMTLGEALEYLKCRESQLKNG